MFGKKFEIYHKGKNQIRIFKEVTIEEDSILKNFGLSQEQIVSEIKKTIDSEKMFDLIPMFDIHIKSLNKSFKHDEEEFTNNKNLSAYRGEQGFFEYKTLKLFLYVDTTLATVIGWNWRDLSEKKGTECFYKELISTFCHEFIHLLKAIKSGFIERYEKREKRLRKAYEKKFKIKIRHKPQMSYREFFIYLVHCLRVYLVKLEQTILDEGLSRLLFSNSYVNKEKTEKDVGMFILDFEYCIEQLEKSLEDKNLEFIERPISQIKEKIHSLGANIGMVVYKKIIEKAEKKGKDIDIEKYAKMSFTELMRKYEAADKHPLISLHGTKAKLSIEKLARKTRELLRKLPQK